jgi:protein-L-isoaspartate(D-aspartate) O-methyltransferase
MAEAVVVLETETFASQAEAALAAQGVDNAAVITGDLPAGAAKHGPYDAIIVEGGIEALPQVILDQLKEGGRVIALFTQGALGTVRIGYKNEGRVAWRDLFNAAAPALADFAAERAFAL